MRARHSSTTHVRFFCGRSLVAAPNGLWRRSELVAKCSSCGQEIVMFARPRRSVLYMPGSNAKALAKAAALPADAVILDLEDSVSPDAKAAARAQVAEA